MTPEAETNATYSPPFQPPPRPCLTEFGIINFSVYVPRTAVAQRDLEVFDNVATGKYTLGLGQNYMSFVTDREDVISLALTAVSALVRESRISYRDVGRLDVGTETLLDKSKAIKTSLMRFFTAEGNAEVEGLDSTNACYGGTAALFNALAWMESSAWDGRYAIVVASDIAVYERGPARPTGGAGAVAMLIGPNAPIRFEAKLRATVMGDTYDFFKPRFDTEFPTVRGQLTVDTYVFAMDKCYEIYKRRARAIDDRSSNVFGLADFFVFHSPFSKMVRKGFARLLYNDFVSTPPGSDPFFDGVEKFRNLDPATSHQNKEAVKAFVDLSRTSFESSCAPGAWLAPEVGNCYTASLYSALAALVCKVGDGLIGKRILLYSFGSGFAASMYSLRVVSSVQNSFSGVPLTDRLKDRLIVSPIEFDRTLQYRERDYGRFGYVPKADVDSLFPGSYYLEKVLEGGEREYAVVPFR